MKSKLQHSDEYSIRYLMKELDPSEEHMVEEMMVEDENVLIDVESLRQTYRKLDTLPFYEAPSEVLDRVMEQAEHYCAVPEARKIRYLTIRKVSYAAAAAMLVGVGLNWSGPAHTDNNIPVANIAESQIPVQVLPTDSRPWVDNRDILHINAAGFLGSGLADSTAGRLRLVDTEQTNATQHRQVHLTGTQR
jgi:hypothetical protein